MDESNGFSQHIIVAGIPRCGSTSLFTYLSHHSDICPSSIKETQFFLSALDGKPTGLLSKYMGFFSGCLDKKYFLEASPSYFFGSEKVAKAIFDSLGKDVKLIFLLRDPIERLESCFFYDIMVGAIPKDSVFEEFIDTAKIDSWRSIESGYYAEYLHGWFDYYKDSIKIVFYDDLKNNPLRLMEELCEWLAISPDCYKNFEFTKENRGIVYKSKTVHLFALAINIRFERVFRRQKKIKQFIRGIYHKVNESPVRSEKQNRSVIQVETINRLRQLYKPYNEQLLALMISNNQKISGWLADFKEKMDSPNESDC